MDKKYTMIMVISFIYGGFLLVTYFFMAYSILWRGELSGLEPFGPRRFRQEDINILSLLVSPTMLIILAGGLISIVNGIAIRFLTHEKEIKKVKADMKSLFLTPEEKHIVSELENSGGDLTQKELTDMTGYSRVKVHRVISRLESKKIIRKVSIGQTNRIIIEK